MSDFIKWSPAQEVLDIVSNEDWCWGRNSKCKYIDLRIDTRDGHCVIQDRNGVVISLDDVKYQCGA